ncbi:putative envelope protein ODV-E66-20 [Microplitis demolitor]|uniref:uncharacterized LOC103574598 n=1 Tax=Microplitis demolitor TaxID=69319 RepID=UPI0006D50311|nr:uncharacterized LOC103574598 [Microplitis demolitor]KAG6558366.1 putative envelope protein ODV-E66-20 [Microplitis demolitor]
MLFIVILLLVIFIIGVIYYMSQPLEEPTEEDSSPIPQIYVDDSKSDEKFVMKPVQDFITKLKKSLSKNPLLPKYADLFNKYEIYFTEAYDKYFVNKGIPNIREISFFSIAMISKYVETNKKSYLSVAENLIQNTYDRLNLTLTDKKIPWNINWYDISILLTRMLATYQLTDGDKELKQNSHKLIVKIIPKINESLGQVRDGLDLASILITRLITNYINDLNQFYSDTELEIFPFLAEKICTLNYTTDITSNGIYFDGSCVENKVATFENLSKFSEFYTVAFRTLDYPVDIDGFITGTFDKILHPTMNFIPYGLFGVEPIINCTEILSNNWPNYEKNSKFGAKIFPHIGLGVFKSPEFVFSLRVQREDIAAYESDPDNFEFPAGWIQMRKLYLTDVDYSKYENGMKWPELKLQPGVTSFADDQPNDFEKLKPKSGRKQFMRNDVKSLIGLLENGKKVVMYWRNEYNFDMYQNVDVIEFGVCTENGLVMRYDVNNKSDRVLNIKLSDNDIDDNLMQFEGKFLGMNYSEGVVRLEKNSRKVINWRQVFQTEVKPWVVNLDRTQQHISFSVGSDNYLIESYDDYHVVRRNGVLTLAGSYKTFSKEIIDHEEGGNNYRFQLDSKTLMYRL